MTSRLTFLFVLLISAITVSAQALIDKNTFLTAASDTIRVGDDITIGLPANFQYEFSFIENDTKNKVGIAGRIAGAVTTVGAGVVGLGAVNGSYEVVQAGANAATAATVVDGVADGADAVLGHNHELTGRQMRVLKFKKEGNPKRGEYFYAVVAGPKQQNYKIEIPLAIQSKEIVAVNGDMFYQEDEN